MVGADKPVTTVAGASLTDGRTEENFSPEDEQDRPPELTSAASQRAMLSQHYQPYSAAENHYNPATDGSNRSVISATESEDSEMGAKTKHFSIFQVISMTIIE